MLKPRFKWTTWERLSARLLPTEETTFSFRPLPSTSLRWGLSLWCHHCYNYADQGEEAPEIGATGPVTGVAYKECNWKVPYKVYSSPSSSWMEREKGLTAHFQFFIVGHIQRRANTFEQKWVIWFQRWNPICLAKRAQILNQTSSFSYIQYLQILI